MDSLRAGIDFRAKFGAASLKRHKSRMELEASFDFRAKFGAASLKPRFSAPHMRQ